MGSLEVVQPVAIRYDVKELEEELGSMLLPGVKVYINLSNQEEILAIMESEPKKTRRALALAMQGIYNKDLYGRENISKKADNVTAIKYKGKLNDRIYCQEVFDGPKKVILVTAYRKKGQAVDTRTKKIIEAVGQHTFILREI